MTRGIERLASWTGLRHVVQFYENDEALYDLVGSFLADGLAAGEPVVAIVTPAHREGIATRLRGCGIADDDPKVTFFDATRTLAELLRDDMPDEQRFVRHVGALLEETTI